MTRQLKLFAIRTKSGLLTDDSNQPVYFASKMAAKAVRDEYNQQHNANAVVTYGTDHKLA